MLSPRTARILGVTAFVSLLGSLGGALGGLVVAVILYADTVIRRSPHAWIGPDDLWFVVGMTSAFGAVAGVLLGPLFAWTLLRRVPLWRAVGETALAAALGAGAAMTLPIVLTPLVAAVLAATLSALRLRFVSARSGGTPLPSSVAS